MLAAIRLFTEPFTLPFMQRALVALVLLAVLGGVVGVVVQLRRLAFLAEAMTHTVFPGVAIAFFLGQSMFAGALIAAAGSAIVLTVLTRYRPIDDDALLAFVLATFFSVGVIVVSRNRTFTADLTALLFGRILTVTNRDIVQIAMVTATTLAVLFFLRKELLLRAFDPVAAAAFGYPVFAVDLVLNIIVALVVVAAIHAVGTALVIALIVTPAATARIVARRVGPMIVWSCVIAVASGWLGLVISYDASVHHDVRLAAGATMVVVLTATFVAVAAGAGLWRRRRGAAAGA